VFYITFTVTVTEWRTRFRREANAQESAAHTKAIDSLLNYETVKYFGNEGFEARRYDENLEALRRVRLKSQTTLSMLNCGQQLIIATALVDTGSRMDEVIFEEFKGTGNMELQLDRRLANKRIYPAVDLVASSTRRDDLLQDQTTQSRMWSVRKVLSEMNPIEAMENVKNLMLRTKDNEEFFAEVNS